MRVKKRCCVSDVPILLNKWVNDNRNKNMRVWLGKKLPITATNIKQRVIWNMRVYVYQEAYLITAAQTKLNVIRTCSG